MDAPVGGFEEGEDRYAATVGGAHLLDDIILQVIDEHSGECVHGFHLGETLLAALSDHSNINGVVFMSEADKVQWLRKARLLELMAERIRVALMVIEPPEDA